MSVKVLRLLYCDGGKECTWGGPYSPDVQLESSADQRQQAHGAGWITIGNRDYCPNCAKRLGKEVSR